MAFMRHNNNQRRHNNNRHRHTNTGSNNNGAPRRHVNRLNQVLDSNGPEGRVRGTAQQIVEKYSTMARDASSMGDKVLMLNYLQHAEHYQRLLNEINEENAGAERERETQRAQNQAQPDVGQQDDASDDAPSGERNTERNSDRHANQPDRAQQPPRRPRPDRPERSERPVSDRAADRPALRKNTRDISQDDADEDDNELPNFLRVPIKTAPEAQKTETGVAEKPVRRAGRPRATPKVADKTDDTAE